MNIGLSVTDKGQNDPDLSLSLLWISYSVMARLNYILSSEVDLEDVSDDLVSIANYMENYLAGLENAGLINLDQGVYPPQ